MKNQPKKGNSHDYHHFIHQSLLRGPYKAGRIHPQARASQAGLCQAAACPENASPVPHLTSLYHFHRAGEYGDRSWPGNCGGNLIKDLLNYFKPDGIVFDPMTGSGHLPRRLRGTRHPCMAWDIHQGFDACDPQDFPTARDVRLHLGSPALLAA